MCAMSLEPEYIEIKPGTIDGAFTWQMPIFLDVRGKLAKSYTAGASGSFPIDFNVLEHFFTYSSKNVFRGLHFQGTPHAVSKIVSIVQGKATDYLLDMRRDSATFGHLQIREFDSEKPISIYIPTGVAHGYIALEDKTIISYKLDGYFCANCDGGISGEVIKEYLPIDFADTIRSEKDLNLQEFELFQYKSGCLD
jgi:dTDP-4-dehydrorhamnose 3,5-epimerase